jgi:hypothetical protein
MPVLWVAILALKAAVTLGLGLVRIAVDITGTVLTGMGSIVKWIVEQRRLRRIDRGRRRRHRCVHDLATDRRRRSARSRPYL